MNANELLAAYAAGQRDFSGANLNGADLTRANLNGADLTRADLNGANLTRANLTRAILYGAILYDAILTRANLYGANLTRADLNGADLNGADLTMTGAFRQYGRHGSRSDFLNVAETSQGLRLKTGCLAWSTLDEFAAAVTSTHGDNKHGQDYRAVLEQIKKDFAR